jgi:hypothetical protein
VEAIAGGRRPDRQVILNGYAHGWECSAEPWARVGNMAGGLVQYQKQAAILLAAPAPD